MNLSSFTPSRLSTLFASDSRNVGRDPTLFFAMVMSIIPAIAAIFWRDAIDAAARDAFGMQSIIFYAMPSILCLPAFLVGWVSGFLFLEDRDDGPLLALEVTPVGKSGFIAYRTGVTLALTFAITMIACPFLIPEQPAWMHLLLSLFVGLEAVAAAFILPAVARNKVEGLALTKLTNVASIAPLLALIPSPLRYVFGIIPTFWLGELLGLSENPELPLALTIAIALAVHFALAIYLFRMINKKTG